VTGRFITFEGIDGSGKSTQARRLAERLDGAILTREPGGSAGAEEVRQLLLTGDPDRWSAETEILLFTAARRDHLEKTIMDPEVALKRGLARKSGEDRFEDFGLGFQETLRHGFLALAKSAPERCVLIDGNRDEGAVAADIAAHLAATA